MTNVESCLLDVKNLSIQRHNGNPQMLVQPLSFSMRRERVVAAGLGVDGVAAARMPDAGRTTRTGRAGFAEAQSTSMAAVARSAYGDGDAGAETCAEPDAHHRLADGGAAAAAYEPVAS